jgi:hypothetical protein
MTDLDKAEAVMAAFRDEVECPHCGRYVPRSSYLSHLFMENDHAAYEMQMNLFRQRIIDARGAVGEFAALDRRRTLSKMAYGNRTHSPEEQ